MSLDGSSLNKTELRLLFGPFQVDPVRRRLLRGAKPIALGGRAFDVLLILLDARGEFVSNYDLLRRAWPTTVVDEHNIQVQISTIRKALADQRKMILTEPGRGYRLDVSVTSTFHDPYSNVCPTGAQPKSTAADDNGGDVRFAELPPAQQSANVSFAGDAPMARPGQFCLIRSKRILLSKGASLELGARACEVLAALAEARGALVSKSDLIKRVWPRKDVRENALQAQISALRRTLGQDRDFIATETGRGYRFTGDVHIIHSAESAASAGRAFQVVKLAGLHKLLPGRVHLLTRD
jgi:DNA-binding winged helix-turn-helix (wHTH) protein